MARPFALVAGAVGDTSAGGAEAGIAASLGYDAVLLCLGGAARRDRRRSSCATAAPSPRCCRCSASTCSRPSGAACWASPSGASSPRSTDCVAVKIAPFDRYRTLDVVRAVADAGRDDVALYTGNDDSIVVDLLTPFPADVGGRQVERRIVGGLLGQWAVWTRRAVEWMDELRAARAASTRAPTGSAAPPRSPTPTRHLRRRPRLRRLHPGHPRSAAPPGTAPRHLVARRPGAALARPGGGDRARLRRYPELTDDDFVAEHLERWLA